MKEYKFETAEFGLTAEGIHLLRSRYNYETIPFEQIHKIRFEKSRVVNNWIVILAIGLASVSFSIFYASILLKVFSDDRVNRIYIEEILIPFLPMVFGLFMIYSSLRTGTMMIVHFGKKTKRFPLEKLRKEGSLESFIREIDSPVYSKSREIELAKVI
jgi:hypothetical protein